MSLIPYSDDSLIINDPHSKSLVMVNPSADELTVYEQVHPINGIRNSSTSNSEYLYKTRGGERSEDRTQASISTYICPQCGTKIATDTSEVNNNNIWSRSNTTHNDNDIRNDSGYLNEHPRNIDGRSRFAFDYSPKYFQLLQATHRRHSLPDSNTTTADNNINNNNIHATKYQSFIPEDLFIPGYFHKFFTTLSLLGNGARGSVFKVVHKIGETELGIFALKKISIGNDMEWFNKCIREVRALSSLTHKSANLITYNHVWLEMDKSYGVTAMDRNMTREDEIDIDTTKSNDTNDEKIPCLFILQQYCSGGNLEDAILIDVFKKFPEKISPEERKKLFRKMKRQKKKNINIQKGLTTRQIVSIIRDIARGLHELHDIGIIHRDLKPSNCLLLEKYKEKEDNIIDNENEEIYPEGGDETTQQDNFPSIVIGDLGESQLIGESRAATGCTGTLEYTAPEVIITDRSSGDTFLHSHKSYNEYTFASDMYSLGMISYFIIFGKLPFRSSPMEFDEMRKDVKNFRINKNEMMREHERMNLKAIDPRVFDLTETLLSINPQGRPRANDVEIYLDQILLSFDENYQPTSTNLNIDNETHFSINVQSPQKRRNNSIQEQKNNEIEERSNSDELSEEIEEIENEINQNNILALRDYEPVTLDKSSINKIGLCVRIILNTPVTYMILELVLLYGIYYNSIFPTINYFTVFLFGFSFRSSIKQLKILLLVLFTTYLTQEYFSIF